MKIETFVSKWAVSSAAGASEQGSLPPRSLRRARRREAAAYLVTQSRTSTPSSATLYWFTSTRRPPPARWTSTSRITSFWRPSRAQSTAPRSWEPPSEARPPGTWPCTMPLAKRSGTHEPWRPPPPFIITTDIGHCFELFAAFDGTGRYSPFPDVKRHRIYLQRPGTRRERRPAPGDLHRPDSTRPLQEGDQGDARGGLPPRRVWRRTSTPQASHPSAWRVS